MFEVLKSDLAGRIGLLRTNHGDVETPAFVPVVHPVKQSIPPAELRRMGFDLVITNAYIAMRRHGEAAVERGIHGVIGFDGPVMTDSGGYQVLEYGDVGVDPAEMARYEAGIGSDIAVPLDRPTGLGMGRKRAAEFVRHTLRVSREALRMWGDGRIWAGPVQGSEHLDLVGRSARTLAGYGFPMLALGSPVEFMQSYEYGRLAAMIAAAKRGIPPSVPLHLFGAGHPLTVPLAVALGCDTFDSASYMLYAAQGRYMSEDGTRRLSEMGRFSCACPACSGLTPAEMAALAPEEGTARLAAHNLRAIKAEVDRAKEAIREGRLWEHAMGRMRSHPRLFEASAALAENADYLAVSTPRFKPKAVLLFSREDQYRPEARNYHRMVRRFAAGREKTSLCVTGDSERKPAYLSPEYAALRKELCGGGPRRGAAGPPEERTVQFCQYSPFLGLIPVELSDVFPAAHYVASRLRYDPADFPEFAATWEAFLSRNKFGTLYYDAADPFLSHFARRMTPKGVRRRALKKTEKAARH